MFLIGFPLLLIPFVIYNIVAFIFGLQNDFWTTRAYAVHMMYDQDWILTWEDVLIAFSIFLLWIEIIKSTRMGMRTIMDHLLAMALFIAMLVEFLLVKQAGTSTFFLLMTIGLVDVLAGFIISIRSSQRQVEVQSTEKI
jgi:hypothetical protein